MLKKITKLSLLPLVFMLTSCTVSPQQAFQNAKLTLVNELKEWFAEGKEITNINYDEMQYIFLSKNDGSDIFPINRYYYNGKITLTFSDKKTKPVTPTTYYDLSAKKSFILDETGGGFKTLKSLVEDKESSYSGSQGTFFPSNY